MHHSSRGCRLTSPLPKLAGSSARLPDCALPVIGDGLARSDASGVIGEGQFGVRCAVALSNKGKGEGEPLRPLRAFKQNASQHGRPPVRAATSH